MPPTALETEVPKPKASRSNNSSSTSGIVEGSKKWYPNQEEQDVLYKDLKFIIEADKVNAEPLDVILWRVYDRADFLLHKYVAYDLNGRIVYKPIEVFRVVDEKRDRAFFTKYLPVYTVTVHETPKIHMIQYFHVNKIEGCLLRMEGTKYLYKDFKVLIQIIASEILKSPPGFIKLKVLPDSDECEDYYKSSWDAMEAAISDRVKFITTETKLASGIVTPFRNYPFIKFSKIKETETNCVACKPRRRKAAFRAEFNGKPYDQFTFEDLTEEFNPPEDLHFCAACTPYFKIVDKLLNHKWCVYRAIRNRITNNIGELGPHEKLEVNNQIVTLLRDHEWIVQAFIELQVALAEADICIERLKKESGRRSAD